MAGINREKKTSKSLIAENRFKKLAKKPSHKKIQTKKKSQNSIGSKPNLLTKVLRKISLFFLKLIWRFFWRSSVVIFIFMSTAVSYYYLNLK